MTKNLQTSNNVCMSWLIPLHLCRTRSQKRGGKKERPFERISWIKDFPKASTSQTKQRALPIFLNWKALEFSEDVRRQKILCYHERAI